MSLPRARIAKQVAEHTLVKGAPKAYAKEVAALLLSEGRADELDSLLRDVQAEWAANGHVEVLAHSAHALTADVHTQISDQVKKLYPGAKKIVVTEVIDPDILGGVQITLADKQLDLSVEAKLNRFKQLSRAGKEQ